MRLEIVVLPVSDLDRAKQFYVGLGWRLDADFVVDDDFRVVQLTPPGSPCSIIFGAGVTDAAPGSAGGLYLVVDDIKAARRARRQWCAGHRDFPRRRRRVSPRRDDGTRARARPGAPQLLFIRVVQRSRWQRVDASGGHDPPAWPLIRRSTGSSDRGVPAGTHSNGTACDR
jgi:catechol 2,3-dioxygenase-like lactoylglutathione lyase family enzyme